MSLNKINEKRIKMIKNTLHYSEGMSKSKIAHITGLHFFVVEDVLKNLKKDGIVEEIDNKWRLKK